MKLFGLLSLFVIALLPLIFILSQLVYAIKYKDTPMIVVSCWFIGIIVFLLIMGVYVLC